uniref:UNC93-like protein MFSD11 n=1 Tax=Globodera pallida TaxID=36090 RepID=A0A183BPW8_GLOPA
MSFRLLPCHWWKGLHRNTRNVLQLGIGFFFIFLAFNSQGFIEESVLDSFSPETVSKHAGYTSLCIIYASFTVLNFVAPPIIKCLGTRTSLVLAGCTYVFFLTGFLFINPFFLYFSSALLGLGAAVIWTAQGKYLTLNSSEQTAGKHSSLFLALTQACLSCGGLFLLAVFRATDSSPPSSSAIPPVNLSSSELSPSFDRPTIKLIYGSFTGIALLGVAVLALLPPSRTKAKMGGEEHRKNATDQEEGALDQIKSIFKLAASRKMVALAFVFGYTGILLSFWSRTKRSRLVFVGMLLHLVAFALTFLILPNETPLGQTNETALIRPSVVIALFCGFLLSFGDAFWTTQIFSFLITNYSNRSAESFALFKFYQSLLTCFLFYLSGHLLLHWHLLILFSSAIIGYLAFVVAEKLEEKERKAFGATGHN